MDAKELAWYVFVALTLVSGIIWYLCKEETDDDFTMYKPLWFIQSDKFSDKGNVYRQRFIWVTGCAFISLFFWALL